MSIFGDIDAELNKLMHFFSPYELLGLLVKINQEKEVERSEEVQLLYKIKATICTCYEISSENLSSASDRDSSKAKMIIAKLVKDNSTLSLKKMSQWLNINPKTLLNSHRKMEEQLSISKVKTDIVQDYEMFRAKLNLK